MELFYAALAGTVLSAAAIIKGIDILRSKSASSDLGFKAFRNNYVLIVTLVRLTMTMAIADNLITRCAAMHHPSSITYVFVGILQMMAADWLQGPYVYALYESYGFTRGEIGHLFIAGEFRKKKVLFHNLKRRFIV